MATLAANSIKQALLSPSVQGSPAVQAKPIQRRYPAAINEDEEVKVVDPNQRNYKGIALAVLVIIMVLGLIVMSVIFLTPKEVIPNFGAKLNLSDLYEANFQPKLFQAFWVDDSIVYRTTENAIELRDLRNNITLTILDNATFSMYKDIDRFFLSPDQKYILIGFDGVKVSSNAHLRSYRVIEIENKKIYDLPYGARMPTKLQHASWQPQPQGNSLVFVDGNDLYHQRSPKATAIQLTSDGSAKKIYNGVPDWLYAEEILKSDHAYWWSNKGTFLCYAKFNDDNVPLYEYPRYIDPLYSGNNVIHGVRYPKAGDSSNHDINPKVKLAVVNTKKFGSTHIEMRLPDEMKSFNWYLTFVSWKDNNNILSGWVNRNQTIAHVLVCSAVNGNCTVNYREHATSSSKWVSMTSPVVDKTGVYFIILPTSDGAKSHFQIAMIPSTVNLPGPKRFLTNELWDVNEIVGYDPKKKVVYFTGTGGDTRKRHLYSIKTSGKEKTKCLTCDISGCDFVNAKFNEDGKYYFLSCLGPDVPTYYAKSTVSEISIVLEDNVALKAQLRNMAFPRTEYVKIEIGGKYKAWLSMVMPVSLNKEHVTKYPMVIDVYGAPNSQRVNFKWRFDWFTLLAGHYGIISARLDGRGTCCQGSKFLTEIYKNLGKKEAEDQFKVLEYLKSVKFIDQERSCVFGRSYGGFVALKMLGKADGSLQCGIAVSPITDFRYYDTFFTERYMGTPKLEDNYAGYQKTNVSRNVSGFKKTKFLLVHGTADDKVHFQNSAQFIKALAREDILFSTQIYPDGNHELSSNRVHLYKTMTEFLKKCFNIIDSDWFAVKVNV